VWVERIVIEGFRRLHGTFEFSPSLTVVVGPNEAGKSSLHEALVRALHGYSKPERRRVRGASLRDRYAPWEGSRDYALVARVRDGERLFEVDWDFETHAVKVTDERGRDVSDAVAGRGDDVELGRYLFGVGLDDFRQVCCIDQDALLAVSQSPSLGVALQEAVANVAGDVAVEEAIERLNEFLRSTVGARTDNLNPTPTGRLSVLARQRRELIEALTASDEARDELTTISAEAARLRAEQDERLRERETVRQRQFLSDAEALAARLDDARRFEREAAAGPEAADSLDEGLVDAVKVSREQLAEAEIRLAGAARDAEAAESEVARLEAEQRQLVPIVDGLRLYESVDRSHESVVRAAAAALAELPADASVAAAVPPRDPLLARYRSERPSLLLLDRPSAHPRLRRVGWIVLVVVTLGLAVLVRKLVERSASPKASSLAERLKQYGATSIDELDRRCAAEDAQVAAAEALSETYAQQQRTATARRAELGATIEGALDVAGSPQAPVEERVTAYLAGCERNAELVQRQAELERVRRELGDARRPVAEAERLGRERQETEARLRASYSAVGIDDPSLDDARRHLDERLAADSQSRAAVQDADASQRALDAVLGAETVETLAAKHAAAVEQHGAHVREHGPLAAQGGESAELAEELATIEELLRSDAARVAELETTARSLEEAVGDPAATKERLAAVEAEDKRLLDARDAVGLARTLLQEAADELSREFAPRLNEALCRNLGRITGGRYHEARVDSDLSVKVVVPETGQVVSADDLSRATKDQIFLVQRLEIARLLAPTKGSAPLLLDDPFAHYDSERLRYGLEILGETAESRQVILFSEDPSVAALADELCPSCAVVELLAPPVRARAEVET
jgi:DNA repair exonuclease SbcCD ATPase subunit